MKRPFTVWLESDEEDWVRLFNGTGDFSSSCRALILDHRCRETNRRNGILRRTLNRLGPAAWAKFGWMVQRRPSQPARDT